MHISLIIILVIVIALTALLVWDLLQRKHSILRTYPVIGHLRYLLETLGVFLRQFFYARDREELPFNRAERTWVYEAAKDNDVSSGFGSTRDLRPIGTIYFVDAPFPVLGREIVKAKVIIIGPQCPHPYAANSFINVSAMSYGALSKNAVLALSAGAKLAGCWLNTGEGGISPYHLSGGCDLVAQIGTAKFGFCNEDGSLSLERLIKAAAHPEVRMFEVKLSQGAKPGKGGLLPAAKVTREIAEIRGIHVNEDSISPNRFPEISNSKELLDFIAIVRTTTGKPTGFKVVLGDYDWLDDLFSEIHQRGIECAPDFITLDGAEGGTGAAPVSLMDYMGLPLAESLPVLVDKLIEFNLRDRIKVIASGKLITPSMIVWALSVGADFVNTARGFLFSLGCIQALQCHLNTCPTGITTHHPWLMRGLDPKNKAVRVYNYVKTLEYEVGMICHSCGVNEPRELERKHVRIVSEHGTSVSMADLYPIKTARPETVKN
jgi:glutamate synthase domain-containing protein 2